jgi:GNAT superfamily N-acetyltransferase
MPDHDAMSNPDVHLKYDLDDDPARIDRDAVWRFMSEQAYWGRWRGRAVVDQQLDNSWRVVGGYERATGELVAFARAVSDGVSLAYLADVYVLPGHRGCGLGVELVRVMVDRGPGAHFRWMLHTGDAHGLYAKFGFAPADRTYLERPGRGPNDPA